MCKKLTKALIYWKLDPLQVITLPIRVLTFLTTKPLEKESTANIQTKQNQKKKNPTKPKKNPNKSKPHSQNELELLLVATHKAVTGNNCHLDRPPGSDKKPSIFQTVIETIKHI